MYWQSLETTIPSAKELPHSYLFIVIHIMSRLVGKSFFASTLPTHHKSAGQTRPLKIEPSTPHTSVKSNAPLFRHLHHHNLILIIIDYLSVHSLTHSHSCIQTNHNPPYLPLPPYTPHETPTHPINQQRSLSLTPAPHLPR